MLKFYKRIIRINKQINLKHISKFYKPFNNEYLNYLEYLHSRRFILYQEFSTKMKVLGMIFRFDFGLNVFIQESLIAFHLENYLKKEINKNIFLQTREKMRGQLI